MNFKMQRPTYLLLIGIVLIVAATVTAFTRATLRQQSPPLPQIVSRIENIEVLGARITRPGGANAAVAIELRNNSDKPIIAITVESGDDNDASGINANGFQEGDAPPTIVLEPRGTIVIVMPLSNVRPGTPIRVGGVMYADGTEEGDEITLGTMRRQRAHYRARTRGASSPQ